MGEAMPRRGGLGYLGTLGMKPIMSGSGGGELSHSVLSSTSNALGIGSLGDGVSGVLSGMGGGPGNGGLPGMGLGSGLGGSGESGALASCRPAGNHCLPDPQQFTASAALQSLRRTGQSTRHDAFFMAETLRADIHARRAACIDTGNPKWSNTHHNQHTHARFGLQDPWLARVMICSET